ncbi:hypothetical protein LMG27177_01860 [Paraburkholderia fynbosensis]|uniref:Uncharacterized protein n=1 Tax=Paraburkholderia fynbosensis TaxID=1200993 RepID=A0A6J5FR37_9BURK|nr:hypothetical protein LMG27177_01860 [Paraburkholderia fynbosensis]
MAGVRKAGSWCRLFWHNRSTDDAGTAAKRAPAAYATDARYRQDRGATATAASIPLSAPTGAPSRH